MARVAVADPCCSPARTFASYLVVFPVFVFGLGSLTLNLGCLVVAYRLSLVDSGCLRPWSLSSVVSLAVSYS